jgi:ABC-2 type transport system ATP-binding protein
MGMSGDTLIEVRQLNKIYPMPAAVGAGAKDRQSSERGQSRPGVTALANLTLDVKRGETFGLLGPNGAGKSTLIGILTTRIEATAGDATIGGHDVRLAPTAVRQLIGVVPQRANPDRGLNVIENLIYHSAYFGFRKTVATTRAKSLLERMGILQCLNRRVSQLSGGELQRLMIARALIHEPAVLFLDEPTVGLDPRARLELWELLKELKRQGCTIVMTTHYLEEADRLCERVAIIDHGKLLALETPAALKAMAPAATMIELQLDGDAAGSVAHAKAVAGVVRAEAVGTALRTYGERGGELISGLISAVQQDGRKVKHVQLTTPSLESLFISLTGRKLA